MLSHEARPQNLRVCEQHDQRRSTLDYGNENQSVVVVHPGVVAHQLKQGWVVAEQIHQVSPANSEALQQRKQRADDGETGQPHHDDNLHQDVRAHEGAVPQGETYGNVSVVRHGAQVQQVQGTVEVNEEGLGDARRVGDEAAPRHNAHDKLWEESCGPQHVADGQAEEHDEHGLVQLFAPGDRSEHQQVAGHNDHVQKRPEQERRIHVRVGQAQTLQLEQSSSRGRVGVHRCSTPHTMKLQSPWKYLAAFVRCAGKERNEKTL